MEPQIYKELAEQENSHWWFCARRAIAASLLKRFLNSSPRREEARRGAFTARHKGAVQASSHPNPPPMGEGIIKILDAGCGSGGNLPMLAQFGQVYGFEMDDASRARARARAIGHIEAGKLPDGIPFGNQSFDLITLFDVLEHIEDDRAALAALVSRLKPGGLLLLNVPAFPFLFSRHDVLHHHYRRYGWDGLKQKIESAGLEILVMNYWNCLLFPVAAAVRLMARRCVSSPIRGEVRRGAQDGTAEQVSRHPGPPPNGEGEVSILGLGTPPPAVNKLLATLVSAERFLIPRLRLPFGISLMVAAKKP